MCNITLLESTIMPVVRPEADGRDTSAQRNCSAPMVMKFSSGWSFFFFFKGTVIHGGYRDTWSLQGLCSGKQDQKKNT